MNIYVKNSKLHKGWRVAQQPPSVVFHKFVEDEALCVVSVLNEYIKRSEGWRGDKTQLILSYVAPHREVTSSTIARWIKKKLSLTGVDVERFKAHSTRSASTSKASVVGLTISDIMKRGSWSKESTWKRFYCREIADPNKEFQDRIFKSTAL